MEIVYKGINNKYKKLINTIYQKALEVTDNNADNLVVSIYFESAKKIKKLNNEFRNIDKATDVLSFPMLDIKYPQKVFDFQEDTTPDNCLNLGDVVICPKIAKQQAKFYNHSKQREVGFLALHGLLHLLGYDHIEKEDEEIMSKTSENILQSLNIKRGE